METVSALIENGAELQRTSGSVGDGASKLFRFRQTSAGLEIRPPGLQVARAFFAAVNVMTELLCLMVFPALMAFAAASDLLTMTISNRVSLALVVGFFALALLVGLPAATVAIHVGLALAVLAAGFAFFACGWIGGGDAKLAAATVLWLGADQSIAYLIYAALLGGLLTLVLLQFRAFALPNALAQQEWVQRLHKPRGGVPYGIALAAAALLVYPHSPIMQALGA